jgi:hypothetical protein
MIKKILLVLFSITLSCANNDDSVIKELHIDLYVVDENGNDLLDPNNANTLRYDDISIYYVVEGKSIRVNNGTADTPKGFSINEPGGIYHNHWIRLYLNSEKGKEISTTMIKWSENDYDTLDVSFTKRGANIRRDKIWINKHLVWDSKNSETWKDNPVDWAFYQFTK